ncbi:MAG: hypothetical protein Q7T20_05970 [Saprospiraceae bacterium]|nr:hypothetical protein [Saprospiraceae bacterium]
MATPKRGLVHAHPLDVSVVCIGSSLPDVVLKDVPDALVALAYQTGNAKDWHLQLDQAHCKSLKKQGEA